jgi:hypothetical protein
MGWFAGRAVLPNAQFLPCVHASLLEVAENVTGTNFGELADETARPYRRSTAVRNGPQTESLQSDIMRLPSAEIVPMQLPTE